MELDINYLIARLVKIDGFGDTGDHLLNIVKSKKSAQATASAAAAAAAAAKSSSDTQLEKKDSDNKDPKPDATVDDNAQKAPTDNNSAN